MADMERELSDLKREVIEARNQAIKTDNQVKNLGLDIRGFEKRFDALEKRTRVSAVGAYVVVALTITIAAYGIHVVQVKDVEGELQAAKTTVEQARTDAAEQVESIRGKLALLEQGRERREKAEELLEKVLAFNAEGKEREAVELLAKLDLEHLSELERKLVEEELGELKRRAGEQAYKNGRNQLTAGKVELAVRELERAVQLDPDGRYNGPARYLLGNNLWQLRRLDDAVPVLREILGRESDKLVVDEIRYYLGTSLAHLGQRQEAQKVLDESVTSGSRFSASAKTYLAALKTGDKLPDLPKRRSKSASGTELAAE